MVIYYAGHGVMCKNVNNIVVLEQNEKKRLYKLEEMSRSLSNLPGSYIITIFDCCREYMAPPNTATRGLDATPVPEEHKRSDTNLILINGC